jgi:ornithine lipid hydroxylase
MLRSIMTWIIYPLVMLAALIIYYTLGQFGVEVGIASYVAATIGGVVIITLLEWVLPYRKEWAPNKEEARTDIIFMLLIQILLPKLLAIVTVMTISNYAGMQHLPFQQWWPHQIPVWCQMLLMMFIADLPRYWLHRAAHEWTSLWRFHAVHHSVKKLNWINVGRFHPIDKSLQFVCDTLPFILLGLSKEVLALYFVVYSIKGFFQHSNVDVKLGWLNYIISGPELHRWHHSKVIKESNTNYGNNVIVWDILFGTFFLPKKATVKNLGLLKKDYPTTFISQMKEPFKS